MVKVIRKSFRATDSNLDALLAELVRRVNDSSVNVSTIENTITKLESIPPGEMTGAEIVAAINSTLGQTGWQDEELPAMTEPVTVGGVEVTVLGDVVTVPILVFHSALVDDQPERHVVSGTVDLTGTEIDFTAASRFNKSLPAGNTAFTFKSAVENRGVLLALYPDPASTISWPAGTMRFKGDFNPGETNYVYILCIGKDMFDALEYGLTYGRAL